MENVKTISLENGSSIEFEVHNSEYEDRQAAGPIDTSNKHSIVRGENIARIYGLKAYT